MLLFFRFIRPSKIMAIVTLPVPSTTSISPQAASRGSPAPHLPVTMYTPPTPHSPQTHPVRPKAQPPDVPPWQDLAPEPALNFNVVQRPETPGYVATTLM